MFAITDFSLSSESAPSGAFLFSFIQANKMMEQPGLLIAVFYN